MGYELSAAYLENGDVLVFKEKGNTKARSFNSFQKEGNDVMVTINGKMVIATGSVHTHPYAYGNLWPENPLGVSTKDISEVATLFDNTIDILVVRSLNGVDSGVYNVGTNGNGLIFPQLKYSF